MRAYLITRELGKRLMKNKYDIVKNDLKSSIVSGTYAIGSKLPSESALMARYQVSRFTVRRAASDLENDHYIYRVQGDGMYVDDWQKKREAVTSKAPSIGVITTHLANYIFPNIISGIDRVVSDEGYNLVISNTHNSHVRERSSLSKMIDAGVKGLIVEPTLSALPNPNLDLYDKIKHLNIPIIFINAHYEDMDFPYLEMDDKQSEQLLIEYLMSQGHHRILGAFKVDDIQGVHRMKGFYQAYQNHPDIINQSRVIMFQSDEMAGLDFQTKIETMLASKDRPTAIAMYNDELAIKIMNMIQSLDLSIPEDVSLVGFDDYQLSQYMSPSLTTAVHAKNKMGYDAAKTLFKLIKKESVESIIYEPKLIYRESVLPPKEIIVEEEDA